MKGSLTLGRIRGIPIRAHFTLLVILPYLAFLMAARFSEVARVAGVEGEAMTLPPLAWGLLLAVALFGCVLAHELGHSLVALAYGGHVAAITLMLLGGVSELRGLPPRPRVEGLVAAAGPLVSLLLGGVALGLNAIVPGPADLRFGLYYLGQINIVLAIFNLLPAFPMDGGRVLRAVLAARLGQERATQIAAYTGSFFAALFVVVGFASGNLVLALIGLFVWSGARAEAEVAKQREQLKGLTVGDVMHRSRETVQGSEPASEAAQRLAEAHLTALPVLDEDELIGMVALRHLEALPKGERERTPTSAVVQRDVPRLEAQEPLADALERLAERGVDEGPVLAGGELVGVLETNDLGTVLRLRKLAEGPYPRRAGVPSRLPAGDRPGVGELRVVVPPREG